MPKKKETEDRQQLFSELVAKGTKPYRAAIEAGYSENYANAHLKYLLGICREKIEKLKPIAQQAIEEKFKYTALDSFKKFQEIQELAMLPDEKGHYNNLTAAAKCEENKARLFGAYETDNSQRAPERLQIKVLTKDEKDEE